MQRPNLALAACVQVRIINAVAHQMRERGRPVGAPDIDNDFTNWTHARLGRTLTLVAKLSPDVLGRRLVFCGRAYGVNQWAVDDGCAL